MGLWLGLGPRWLLLTLGQLSALRSRRLRGRRRVAWLGSFGCWRCLYIGLILTGLLLLSLIRAILGLHAWIGSRLLLLLLLLGRRRIRLLLFGRRLWWSLLCSR